MNNRIIVFVLVVGLLIPISSWGQHRQFEIGKGIQKSDYTMAFIPGKVQAQYDYVSLTLNCIINPQFLL